MKKLAVILALMFGATGVVFAADAPTTGTSVPAKAEAKSDQAKPDQAKPAKKKAGKKAAKKAEAAKTEAETK